MIRTLLDIAFWASILAAAVPFGIILGLAIVQIIHTLGG